MQEKLKKILDNHQVLAAGMILLAVLLSWGALSVNSKYVFRGGLEGIVIDRYETNVKTIDDGEDEYALATVAEGSFRVHINHTPLCTDGVYNLQIWNPVNNSYLMRVEIIQTQNEVDVTLLNTDLIRTGYKMDEAALEGALEGTATAVFTAYDKVTLEEIGTAEVELTLLADSSGGET